MVSRRVLDERDRGARARLPLSALCERRDFLVKRERHHRRVEDPSITFAHRWSSFVLVPRSR